MPLLVTGAGVFLATTGASTTTWDPAHTDAQTTLTNGNLTATTASGSFSYSCFRSIASHSTGKFYSEHAIIVDNSFAAFMGIGIFSGARSLTDGFAGTLGGGGSLGYQGDGTVTWSNSGTPLATIQTFSQVNTIAMAIDLGAKLAFFKNLTTASNWNNNGSADPATGTGGIDFTGIVDSGQPFYVAMQQLVYVATAQQSTSNFGGSSYVGTPPTNFLNW